MLRLGSWLSDDSERPPRPPSTGALFARGYSANRTVYKVRVCRATCIAAPGPVCSSRGGLRESHPALHRYPSSAHTLVTPALGLYRRLPPPCAATPRPRKWQRVWDSNPRRCCPLRFSGPSPSSARPTLCFYGKEGLRPPSQLVPFQGIEPRDA